MSPRKMGLPIAKLIVATNVNDILHRALVAGDYSVGSVTPTAAPSMDIQVSSNFERLLFDLHGRDGAALAASMQGFEANKTLAIPPAMRAEAAGLFTSADRCRWHGAGDAPRLAESSAMLIDPHTAIGVAAAQAADLPPTCRS
jgi:threonine synthase